MGQTKTVGMIMQQSQKSIPPVRNFAPYVYLVNDPSGNNGYVLFVCIHLMAGTKAVFIGHAGDKYLFQIEDDTNTSATLYYGRHSIAPTVKVPNEFGIIERRTVMVEVLHKASITDADTKGSYKIGIDVNDADIKPAPGGNIAYNRPYLYLTNPNAVSHETTENDLLQYVARCHVPLERGWAFSRSRSTKTTNGTFIEEIHLVKNGNSIDTRVAPENIQSNSQSYEDTGRKNGYYAVLVTEEVSTAADGTIPTTEATRMAAAADTSVRPKVNNQSSDNNSTGFIE